MITIQLLKKSQLDVDPIWIPDSGADCIYNPDAVQGVQLTH